MFFKNKRKKEKELDIKLQQITKEKESLQKEREQLLKIKEMMENTNYVDTIDISNVYIWSKNQVHYLVEFKEENATEKGNSGMEYQGYKVTLTDIFSEKIIYEKFSENKINRLHEVEELGVTYNTLLYPIYEREHNLLIYADRKVPKYVLLQLYYNLNNINLNTPVLKKQ